MAVDQHLQSGEEILYRAHPSRIPLIAPLVGALLVFGVGIALSAQGDPANRPVVWIVCAIPILLLLGVAGLRWLRLLSREYILTNHRLIQQSGLLSKRSIDSYLEKINNIEHSQTAWGRLLGYGTLRIDTANMAEPSEFVNIADPLGFKRAISAAAEAYRMSLTRPAPAAAPAAAPIPSAERLRQLKSLLDDGLISPAEFEAKRKQLLDEI
jgi:uncharacterized membrane protein YdbT with pleckstrin-like domain